MKKQLRYLFAVMTVTFFIAGCSNKSGTQQQVSTVAEHSCLWEQSNITVLPSCTEEGVLTYTCSICHGVRQESVPKASHQYVVKSGAGSCLETGWAVRVCMVCGKIDYGGGQESALGHDFQKVYAFGEPDCTKQAYYNLICSVCGAYGGDGVAPMLSHKPVVAERVAGDCASPTIEYLVCSECGVSCGINYTYSEEHDWIFGETDPYWEEASQSFVSDLVVYCSKCNQWKE